MPKWTPDIERQAKHGYSLKCKYCGKGYNYHHPWPELPCPKMSIREWYLILRRYHRWGLVNSLRYALWLSK